MIKNLILFFFLVSIYAADGIDFTIDMKNDKPIFVIKDISYEDVGKAVFAYKSLIIKNHSVNPQKRTSPLVERAK
mgnify:CR=1 FL=1